MSLVDLSGAVMSQTISFVPLSNQTVFDGKMVWTVTKCNDKQHTFTSKLDGYIGLTGNPALVFTPSLASVDPNCPLTSATSTQIVATGVAGPPANFGCTMTFPFTIKITDSMLGANIRTVTISSNTVFGSTLSTKTGPGGVSLDVVAGNKYTFVPSPPCSAGTIAPDQVNLGTYAAAMFNSGSQAIWQNFSVRLSSCYDLTKAIFTITYDAVASTSNQNLIKNTGTAAGIGVELANLTSEAAIASGAAFTPTVISTTLSDIFSLRARMRQIPGVAVQAGSVNASATLTLSYP